MLSTLLIKEEEKKRKHQILIVLDMLFLPLVLALALEGVDDGNLLLYLAASKERQFRTGKEGSQSHHHSQKHGKGTSIPTNQTFLH